MSRVEPASAFANISPLRQSPKSLSLPASLPPRGLRRETAAAYIGVGSTKFDQMVKEGAMPKPRIHGGRKLWDRSEIDFAFSELPHDGDGYEVQNPWIDVGD